AQGNRCKHIRAVGFQQMFLTQAAQAMRVMSGMDKQQIPMTPKQLDAMATAQNQLDQLQAEDTVSQAWLEMDQDKQPTQVETGRQVGLNPETIRQIQQEYPRAWQMYGDTLVTAAGPNHGMHTDYFQDHFRALSQWGGVPPELANRLLPKPDEETLRFQQN